MKILYIANERQAAEGAAFALRIVAPDVAVTWGANLSAARRWIDENHDVEALIVEVESDNPNYELFVNEVRGLGVTAPVIAVSLNHPPPPLTALKAVAAEIVTKTPSFLNDLPDIVRRSLHTVRPARRRLRLLYVGDAALARQCLGRPGGSIDVVEAVPGLSTKFDLFDIVLIEHSYPGVDTLAILKAMSARKLHVPVVVVAEWDEALAVLTLKLGAIDYVAKSQASFRAVFFRLNRLVAHSALLTEQARLRDAHTATLHQERAQRQDLETRVAEAQTALKNVEQRLSDAVGAIEQARWDRSADVALAAELDAQREADFAARLAEATEAGQRLARQLAEQVAALQHAERRATTDQQAASDDFARRQSEFEAAVTADVEARRALETKLAEAEASHREAERLRLAELASSADTLAQQHAAFTIGIAEAMRARDALEQRLNEALAAIEQARQERSADADAAAEHLAQREAALNLVLANTATTQERLERRLADADAALLAEQRAAAEQRAERQQAAEGQAQIEAELARETANRLALARQFADAQFALHRAEEHQALEATAAEALRARLVEAEAAQQHASLLHASELSDAATRLIENQEKADARLAQVVASANVLERELADAVAAFKRMERQAAVERQSASEEAAQRQTKFDAELAWEVSHGQALARTLDSAEAALQRAEQQHASDVADAAARLAETQVKAGVRLAQADAVSDALESKLVETAAALEHMEQQAAGQRQAAAEEAAQRQADFEAELAEHVATRQALEKALADTATELRQESARRHEAEGECANTRAASEQAQLDFLDQVAAMRQSAREQETHLEERVAHLQMEGNRARQSLAATEEQIQRLESAHNDECASLERARMAIEADLAQTRALTQETMERVARDRATERTRLEALVAERDRRLQEQAAHQEASNEAAVKTLADVEHQLRLTLAAGARDSRTIAQLQDQLNALGEELETIRSERDVLKTAADHVPQLLKQIDEIRAENRRRFENSPVNMCRCSRDGAVTQVSHALASLLGYDTPEEVQKVDFAGTVFESGDELQWIVDRCLASRSTESVETTWRRKDGSRVIVRVLAVATTADSVDLAAQDITAFRVLEERLRNSQRMEAVARYGSEVAVNCGNLLSHVKQEGQQWLARIDSDAARYHGELLLDEVTRAAGFLRQLGVYGNEQKNVPELVDVNKVLRDLAPVLKRVAGGNIELVLPKASTPLNLDVEAERVERMLVNVAAYGRERMPLGGRLMIEVASVVVDREFVAKYPNVRPGAHVLLTVNEVKGAARPNLLAAVRPHASGANAPASASENPGVDLGALQALVSDCGGHLWMTAEPPGDMMLKIHLPRRVLDIRH